MIWLLPWLAAVAFADFREQPTNQTVLIGTDVTLRCSADVSPQTFELYSQWRTNTGDLLGYHEAGQLTGHQGRYSYLKENPDELHLRIEQVSLEDDGIFECQMLGLEDGPLRAAAALEVIVAPEAVYFDNYRAGSEVEINEDSSLNVTCVARNSKPLSELKWYINGRRIEENINKWEKYHLNKTATAYSSLLWRPRRGDHRKLLTCEAVHQESSSQIRANITMNVLFPSDRPRVSIIGGDSFVKAGDNVTLLCIVQGGNPQPNVTWYLNNRPIDSRFLFDYDSKETRNTYSFIADADDNMAVYECRSQNSETTPAMKSSVHIKVAFAPQAVDIFGETSIKQGGVTTVQCRSRVSNPPAKISWFVNGHPVPAMLQSEHRQPHGTVSISNLTVNSLEVVPQKHQIVVECNARNDEGFASKQHIVKILVPPQPPKISGIEDAPMIEGEVVNVTCESHGGNPLADLYWFRGYDKVSGARSAVSGDSVLSSLSLTIDRSMNNQRLRCEASNAALEEPLVDWKLLNVFFPPRRVAIRTPESSRHQMISGTEFRLLCSAPSSNPPAEITWYFYPNGEQMPVVYSGETIVNETVREQGFTVENVVTFVPTEQFDGTLARCVASNPSWSTSRNVSFPLNVYYAPRLLVGDRLSIVVAEGDSFRENLTVRANPPVSAWRWRKNGVAFDHIIGGVFARGASLSGRNLQPTDAGTYTLYAINSVGTTNVSIHLTVEYPAKIVHISTPQIASVGDEVVLECEVDGVPPTKEMVQWMRHGKEIPSTKRGEQRAVLRVNASSDAAGQYVCRGYNGVGDPVESPAYVLVKSAPTIVRTPAFARASGPLGGKARVRCRATAVPDAEFIWERNGEQIRNNNTKFSVYTTQLDYTTFESTLWISSLSPEDYRDIKCICSNSLGEDGHIISVGPLSAPDLPGTPQLTNITANTISVSWVPGFDGGTDQTFEIRYQLQGEDEVTAVNTTHNHVRVSGLQSGSLYVFQVRAHNTRGFSSDFTRPPVVFGTLTEDGINVAQVLSKNDAFPKPTLVGLAAGMTVLVLINSCLLCLYFRRQRRKKIQEKTEIVRKNINGDASVRPVQMYGAITGSEYHQEYIPQQRGDGVMHGSGSEVNHEQSEDDHSVRTMIEVNPNGYMQQIDPAFYERNCLVEYEFDPYSSSRDYSSNPGTMRHDGGTYTNMPYPEPPQTPQMYTGSLSRRNLNNNTGGGNNNHMLSTFIQTAGVRPGPLNYSQLDGDLV